MMCVCNFCDTKVSTEQKLRIHLNRCAMNPMALDVKQKICCIKCQKEIAVVLFERHLVACSRPSKGPKVRKQLSEEERKRRRLEYVWKHRGLPQYMQTELTEEERKNPTTAILIRKLKNPVQIKRSSEKRKKTTNTPEYKRMKSQKAKESYKNNPELRKIMSDNLKSRIEEWKKDPDFLKKYCPTAGGRTKIYEHNGMFLHGTWEVTVAEKLDELNIEWTNKIVGFSYEFQEKTHRYYPDFYLPKLDMYIEVKGYEVERDAAKWAVVPNLTVLRKDEIMALRKGESITKYLEKK